MKRLPVFFACLLACYTTCEAQIHRKGDIDTTQTSRSYNLNPVVVTGSGHHQRLKSTATPVHVMSKREIQEQGITTFDQAVDTNDATDLHGTQLHGYVPPSERTGE